MWPPRYSRRQTRPDIAGKPGNFSGDCRRAAVEAACPAATVTVQALADSCAECDGGEFGAVADVVEINRGQSPARAALLLSLPTAASFVS